MDPNDNPLPVPSESAESVSDYLQKLEARLARLNQRIQRIEDAVTSEAFDWDRRFNESD
ncbi:MAG TPA: hypothetical protein VE860_16480 [Chthoniobacterales bacterium]|jgi:hypothetical protein|nr:hypothetical protein [Chthoniobacterales bacterium]